jgi:hypothetical protein
VPSKDPAIVRRRSRGSLPRLHLVQAIAAPAYDTVGVPGANCDRTIRFFWRVPPFRHLPKRMFSTYRWGRGKAECGASAEGWRERPALALFRFWNGFAALDVNLMTAARQRPPAPHAATVKAPPQAGLSFFNHRVTRPMLAAIGLHTYTDVQWNVTPYGSYCRVDRTALSPDTPAFRSGAACGSPSPDAPASRAL